MVAEIAVAPERQPIVTDVSEFQIDSASGEVNFIFQDFCQHGPLTVNTSPTDKLLQILGFVYFGIIPGGPQRTPPGI